MRASPVEGKSRFYESSDGLRLHLRDYDPGPCPGAPLVCLPGLTRSSDDFDPLAARLAAASHHPRRVIAFDYRGRGQSAHDPEWRHYDLATEWADMLRGLALCQVDSAHFLGTSRGGLHLMAAATGHRDMIRAVVLNDIGPVLETAGLERIRGYVGKPAAPRDIAQAVQLLKISVGLHFTGLSEDEWRLFATTTFGSNEAGLGLRYDPALTRGLENLDLSKPLPDLWAQFDALRDLPVLTIRGSQSDLLSQETLDAMTRRWAGCESHVVPKQGHAPLLADDATIARIAGFLAAADR